MRLLTEFNKYCGPGAMAGCTLRQWLQHLKDNRYSIDLRYWPRALLATYNSAANSFWNWREQRFHQAIEQTEVAPPLFVLGIWRSGTTHLHNLLAQDDRFAFPNLYQVVCPNTFLSTEHFTAPIFSPFIPKKRPMDNVKLAVQGFPSEDEFALTVDGLTDMNRFAFPRSDQNYHRFLTFDGASAEDIERWKSKLMWFLKKVTFKYQRPLVLKSPGHTGRIKVLLEMFPNAKFVNIHRHPHRVVQSTLKMRWQAFAFWAFQKPGYSMDGVLADYAEVMQAYFAQRQLIPKGNLCEIAYDELVEEPVSTIERVYKDLSLPEFAHMQPSLEAYLASIADYKTNKLQSPSEEVCRQLAKRMPRVFEEWNYRVGSERTTVCNG